MPSRNGLTLSDFRRMGIPLTWPEAVAVLLEAAEQVKRSGDTSVTPDLDHVLIGPDGALTILPGSPIPAHPVRQAAGLLSDALDSAPAPAELRALIAENRRNPPACAWIEEFTTALAYYERPHRGQIIAALARRAADHVREGAARQANASQRAAQQADRQDSGGFLARLSAWWQRLTR
jgi:truncated hemoglobin YjbI